MEEQITIGQKLYRRFEGGEIKEYTVKSIGKKYFYTEELGNRCPINKIDLRHVDKNYTQHNFTLYLKKQEIKDIDRKNYIISILRDYFSWNGGAHKQTLENLEQVLNILKP